MDKILGIVRHVLTFAGGALVSFGWSSQVDITSALTSFDSVVGGAATLIGVGLSIYNAIAHKDKVVAAASTAAATGSVVQGAAAGGVSATEVAKVEAKS